MGCGKHLVLLFLMCPVAFTASFSECMRSDLMERFWQSPWYASSNPSIYMLPGGQFYSFQFDNASQNLSLQGIDLADGAYLLNRLPPGSRAEFSQAASSLDSARSSLDSAKAAQLSAHAYSLSAQRAAAQLLSPAQLQYFFAPFPMMVTGIIMAMPIASEISDYVQAYPQEYGASLSHLANA